MAEFWSSSPAVLDLHLDLQAVPGTDAQRSGRRATLESALRAAIRQGRLAPATRLPSSRVLAGELGMSRGTVTAAYDQLVGEGYLVSRPGAGTVVAAVPARLAEPDRAAPERTDPRYDLRPGLPDVSSFPTRAWLAAARRVLGSARPEVFAAGDPQGRIELRRALADYLGRSRGVIATPDRIVVSSGYYQGLSLLCGVLAAAGIRTAAVEDPGHNHFREVVRRAGFELRPLPVDAAGARIDALQPGTGAVFLTPAHQYPMGVPLAPGRRRALAGWAGSTGALIVEDDYDGEYRYDRQPVGALQGIAPDRVVYCGTASKTLGPALRLAWMVLPPPLVSALVRARQQADQYAEPLGQLILADLIAGHAYERHVRTARQRYRRRRERLMERLATFPSLTAHGVPAGLHVTVTLPEAGRGEPLGPGPEPEPVRDGTGQRADAREPLLLARCSAAGIGLRGLTELHVEPAGRPEGLLIGFGAPSERGFPAALDALTSELGRALSQHGISR